MYEHMQGLQLLVSSQCVQDVPATNLKGTAIAFVSSTAAASSKLLLLMLH